MKRNEKQMRKMRKHKKANWTYVEKSVFYKKSKFFGKIGFGRHLEIRVSVLQADFCCLHPSSEVVYLILRDSSSTRGVD